MDRLLARRPLVSLHVNEANGPAVRVYEKVGFDRADAFRLITVGGHR
jgi:predicted GNAT family acetyltransferase